MGKSVIQKFCSVCEIGLKRQVMGSNVLYYCKNCGRVSSEASLSGGSQYASRETIKRPKKHGRNLTWKKGDYFKKLA